MNKKVFLFFQFALNSIGLFMATLTTLQIFIVRKVEVYELVSITISSIIVSGGIVVVSGGIVLFEGDSKLKHVSVLVAFIAIIFLIIIGYTYVVPNDKLFLKSLTFFIIFFFNFIVILKRRSG